MFSKRELVRLRRGRVAISQWVHGPSTVPSLQEPSDIEVERERVNARYRELGGKGASGVRTTASSREVSEERATARLQEQAPANLRYQTRGRVRIRLR